MPSPFLLNMFLFIGHDLFPLNIRSKLLLDYSLSKFLEANTKDIIPIKNIEKMIIKAIKSCILVVPRL